MLKQPVLWIGAALAFGWVGLRLVRRRRRGAAPTRKRPLRKQQEPAMTLYQKVLRRCARAGAERGLTQTPGEFARSLKGRNFPGADVVDAATELYYRSRF